MCIDVFLHVCLYSTCMPDAHRGQNRALDALGLEFQVVVNCYVGAGIKP